MNDIDHLILSAIPEVTPSATLVVLHRGDVLWQGAWGDATLQTLFDLASLTKLFTATAFLTCAPEALHTSLVEWIPEFGEINPRQIDGGQDPHTKQTLPTPQHLVGQTVDPTDVTIWHLLTHTAGLPPWRDIYKTSPPPTPPTEPDSLSRLERWQRGIERLCAVNFVDTVGTAVHYSDIGFMLLGEVVARLDDGDLAQAIYTHVLEPIELSNTLFNPVRDHHRALQNIAPTEMDTTWRKRRVWGEVHDENACGVGGVAGHAGLFGTAADVARFGQMWLERVHDGAIWREAVQQQVETDDERRGLGWMLPSVHRASSAGDLMSRQAFGHTGFTGTSLWVDPTRELVVAFLTNRVYVGRERPGIFELRRAVHDAVVRSIL